MKKFIIEIVNDTLKKDGKYSRTSLTMFSAWMISVYLGVADFYLNGFNLTVFSVFVGVALGSKLVDAQSTKIISGIEDKNKI